MSIPRFRHLTRSLTLCWTSRRWNNHMDLYLVLVNLHLSIVISYLSMIKSIFVNYQICLSRFWKYQICIFQLLDLHSSILKSTFYNNMIWSGGLHPARENNQTGGCGSFSKTLNCQLGQKSILFTQGDLVWPEKCGKPEIYLLPSLNAWGTSLPKFYSAFCCVDCLPLWLLPCSCINCFCFIVIKLSSN